MNFSFSRILYIIRTLISSTIKIARKKWKLQKISSTAVTFLEYWKRKNASLAHHWDCMGFQVQFTNKHKFHFPLFQFSNRLIIIQDEEERPRPEFAAKAPYLEKNPITGVREPAFPKAVRCLSLTTNGCFLSLVAQHCFPTEFKHTIPSWQFFVQFQCIFIIMVPVLIFPNQIAENCRRQWPYHAHGRSTNQCTCGQWSVWQREEFSIYVLVTKEKVQTSMKRRNIHYIERKHAQIMLVVIFILAVIIYRTLASIYLFRLVLDVNNMNITMTFENLQYTNNKESRDWLIGLEIYLTC